MNIIQQHFDKDNLHHAYLLEGARELVVPEIFAFCENLNIKTSGNPDFVHMHIDTLKREDAVNLRAYGAEKSFTGKRIFVISVNSFLIEAQNTLLKLFEEPIPNTHFFLIVPDANILLRTLVSRFFLISARQDLAEEAKDAEKFISMPLFSRINFIKELLTTEEDEDEEGNEIVASDSTRSKAIKFLNALEFVLHSKLVKNFSGLLQPSAGTFPVQNSLSVCLEHFFKVREFLRMPGSSAKSLMESVALITPSF
ncbi:hypothetical protein HYW73_03090 [Candidatus Nomurabacteria bacterium]|nr:hypothetical protein [Candidatus Nomurabacteria bacterium]